MKIIEKAQQIEKWFFFMNDQNIMFGYTPYGKIQKNHETSVNSFWLMSNFFMISRSTWEI